MSDISDNNDGIIAVVGMSGRFPGAKNLNEYWRNLVDGRVAATDFTDEQLRAAGVDAARIENPNYVKKGYVLDDVDLFDAAFFDFSPREAEYIDPQQRLFLETAWEALEQAGHTTSTGDLSVGVFAGASLSGYFVTYFAHGWAVRDLTSGMQIQCGNDKDYICTRASYKLDLRGPSVNVQAACSTSLVAVCQAYESLVNYQCDLALAGGVTVRVPHRVGYLYDEGGIFSPDGYCRSFDQAAKGTVFGSGVGVVALRRLEDALKDGDPIHALIKGAAINNDGAVKIGFTAPSARGQAEVIATAQAIAGVKPESIQYIEAHGTGTHLGDPIEVAALTEVFRDSTQKKGFCAIGSVKSNIGHLEAAAGIAAFIKTCLALENAVIPPSLHFTKANPQINFDSSPFFVNAKSTPWKANGAPRRAGVSSFGIGGTNSHVILEGAPTQARAAVTTRGGELLVLSGKSAAALTDQIKNYRAYLTAHAESSLEDVCYTAGVGRSHFAHRLAVVASNATELRERLAVLESEATVAGASRGVVEGLRPKVAFLCTGQGAQYAGMARELYEREPVFRAVLDRCAACLQSELERPLLAVMFEPGSGLLDETGYTQPALYALEVGLAALWSAWGIVPDMVMGHSVGEYAAAHIAGVFSLEDGLRLIAARGRLMQALPTGGAMVAVMASAERMQGLLAGQESQLALAAVNGPESVVISGVGTAVDALCRVLEAEGIVTRRLTVSHAFHSPLMEPMLAAFDAVARGITYQAPKIALVSNVSGELAGGTVAAADYWVRHVRSPVRFAAGVRALVKAGVTVCVELGPKPVLLGMARGCVEQEAMSWLASLRPGQSDVQSMLESLGGLHVKGVAVDWRGVYAERGYRKIVLPTYPFQRKRFWASAGATQQAVGSSHQSLARSDAQHPLIGQRLHLAGSKQIRYESVISCDTLEYLTDHRVFDQVLFPATGYVEMAVAVGRLLDHPGLLRDLHLQQPLLIPENEAKTLQCVLTPIDAESYSLEVFSLTQTDAAQAPDWVLHVTGKLASGTDEQGMDSADLAELRNVCKDPLSVSDYYQQFEERGIVYGPAFRTIRNLWCGDSQVLAEISLPDTTLLGMDAYQIHPALLDACLQVFGAALPNDGKNSTYLPMGIEAVHVAGRPGGTVWVHARPRSGEAHEPTLRADLSVYGPKGEPIVEIRGLILAHASRAAFADINPQQLRRWLYEVDWKAQRLHGKRLSPDFFVSPAAIEQQLAPVFPAVLEEYRLGYYSPVYARIRHLCLAYVVRALQQMGFTFEPGHRFTLDGLAEELGVVAQHRRQFARLVSFLDEDNVIEAVGDEWIVKAVPDVIDPRPEALGLIEKYPTLEAHLELLIDCGANTTAILRGEVDPLHIIFPQGSMVKASRLYTDAPATQSMNEMVRRSIEAAIAAMPAGRQLRVLEIGGGTGGTTATILSQFPADRTEYTFTDISPAFLGKAKERFKHHDFVEYKVLNIENAPADQGFMPHTFDMVVAANVLHATVDLRTTMQHVNQLLAPSGLLVLLEGTKPIRLVDLIFGWTDGWWRFTDLDLRKSYPLITSPQWREVLQGSGFSQVSAFPSIERPDEYEHDLSVILAQSNALPDRAIAEQDQWVIFDDQGATSAHLIDLLEAQGGVCLRVKMGKKFTRCGEHCIEMAPDSISDFQALREIIHSEWTRVTGVVDLWSLDAKASAALTGEQMLAATEQTWGSALNLVKILPSQENTAPPRLWLITQGAQPVDKKVPLAGLVQSPVWGLARAVAMEYPELHCTCVDLDPLAGTNGAELLAQEIWSGSAEDQIAWRGHGRYVARLVRCTAEAGAGQPDGRNNSATHSGKLQIAASASGELSVQLRAQATYLITGGLGGLGRTVARWMVERGAGRIVLVGRGDPDAAVRAELDLLREMGADIVVARADAADSAQLARVIAETTRAGFPLRGIVQSAGVLDDAALAQQDRERFVRVMAPKIAGAWNLHHLTLACELDLFVLFSSVAALFGSPGQANHSAANTFLDALAHYRRTQGQAAMSINWGAWAKVGSATDVTEVNPLFKGTGAMEPAQAIWILEQLLIRDTTQTGVLPVDWSQFASRNVTAPLLTDLMQASNQLREPAGGFLQRLQAAPLDDRIDLLKAFVRTQLINVLGLDATSIVDTGAGLFDLGLDSLTAVEFRNRIQIGLDCTLSSTLAFNYPTIDAVVSYLCQSVLEIDVPVQGKDSPGASVAATADEDLDDLSAIELSQMLENELLQISQDT